ncbi:unnamed protein product [Macrosiphum euphorbiae]|uniref:Uncharacterized protein n=1 Tax=Macrosiphum euphorbiae TaxID=13131 RepID=A0AAV0W6M7_9HEMI|nr:unnamed protein product [Macrosiphum euphorbiae]
MDVTREFHIVRSEFSATGNSSVDRETQDLVRVTCRHTPFCRSITYYSSTVFGCTVVSVDHRSYQSKIPLKSETSGIFRSKPGKCNIIRSYAVYRRPVILRKKTVVSDSECDIGKVSASGIFRSKRGQRIIKRSQNPM